MARFQVGPGWGSNCALPSARFSCICLGGGMGARVTAAAQSRGVWRIPAARCPRVALGTNSVWQQAVHSAASRKTRTFRSIWRVRNAHLIWGSVYWSWIGLLAKLISLCSWFRGRELYVRVRVLSDPPPPPLVVITLHTCNDTSLSLKLIPQTPEQKSHPEKPKRAAWFYFHLFIFLHCLRSEVRTGSQLK